MRQTGFEVLLLAMMFAFAGLAVADPHDRNHGPRDEVTNGPTATLCEAYCVEYVLHARTGIKFIVNSDYNMPVSFVLNDHPRNCYRSTYEEVCVSVPNFGRSCDFTKVVWLKTQPRFFQFKTPVIRHEMKATPENSCQEVPVDEVPIGL